MSYRKTVVPEVYDLPDGRVGMPLKWDGDYVILGELDRWQTWRLPIKSLSKPRCLQGPGPIGDKEWRETFGKERMR